jgi:hypothetical protein
MLSGNVGGESLRFANAGVIEWGGAIIGISRDSAAEGDGRLLKCSLPYSIFFMSRSGDIGMDTDPWLLGNSIL